MLERRALREIAEGVLKQEQPVTPGKPRLVAGRGGGCGTTPDPWLTVYSGQGAQLATNDDGGGCGYQSDLTIHVPAGRVYVEVRPFPWNPTRTGSYRLYAEIP